MTLTLNKEAYFERIGYKPHDAQSKYHESGARFRVPCCGRRFGKSKMVGHEYGPRLFLPKNLGWIVGPTYSLGEKEFRVLWDDLIVTLQLGLNKKVKKAYNLRTGDMYIEYPGLGRIEVKSAQHPENLVGEALDWVIMSEAAKHTKETWERYIRPGLTDKRGDASFPSTPEGYNWYYNLWLLGKAEEAYESWKFPTWLNTVMYPGGYDDEEIQLIKRTVTPEWFMQEIGADFASFVGRIFGEFDDYKHVKQHYFNPEWPSYGTWDWGFVNARAFIEFQVDPDDNVYVWRESVERLITLPEHVEKLKEREDPPGYHLDLCFGDAADPEAAEYVTQHFCTCIADPDAKSNWRQGVELVKKFLKEYHDGVTYDEYERPIVQPKYFADPGCPIHISEMNNYRTKDTEKISSAANEAGSSSTSVAVKKDDHTVDAIRYGLMHVFELGYGANIDYTTLIQGSAKPTPHRETVGVGAMVSGRTNSGFKPVTTGMRF